MQAQRLKSVWKQLDFWLSPIKTVIDIFIIIIVVLSLRTAQEATEATQEANDLSRQAISTGYTPWIKLVAFSIDSTGDTSKLNYTLKNFSQVGIAHKVRIKSLMPNIKDERFTFTYDVLMPGEEGSFTLYIPKQGNGETLNALASGGLPVRISVTYRDRFGVSYMVEQEIKQMGGIFKMTEYLIKD